MQTNPEPQFAVAKLQQGLAVCRLLWRAKARSRKAGRIHGEPVSHVELACEHVESVASNARRDAQSSVELCDQIGRKKLKSSPLG